MEACVKSLPCCRGLTSSCVRDASRNEKAAVSSRDSATTEDQLEWNYSYKDCSIWWNHRRREGNLKGSDFRHSKDASRYQPWWIQAKLNSLQEANAGTRRVPDLTAVAGSAPNGVLSASDLPWQEYFAYPFQWWDNRNRKLYPNSPDFKHKITKEGLWIDSEDTPEWVREALEKKISTKVWGHRSQSGVGTDRHAAQEKPQLSEVKEAHLQMMASTNELQLCETNTLLDMYVKCGSMGDARQMFDNMSKRNEVSWNVMIRGYAKKEQSELALELFAQMQQEGFAPDDRTFVGALKACSNLATQSQVGRKSVKVDCLKEGRAIHSQVVDTGFEPNVFVGTALVDMYAKCGSMVDAQHVFDKLPYRDVVAWNALILGYAQKEEGETALRLYAQMQLEGVAPNDRTFVTALKACSSLTSLEEGAPVNGKIVKIRCLEKGRTIHSHVMNSGFESDLFVRNTLVDMYTKCGSLEDAVCVFEKMPRHDVVSWNARILAHAEMQEGELALQLYAQMQEEGITPDDRTFVGALKACGSLAALEDGKQAGGQCVKIQCLEKGRAIHSRILRSGCEKNVFVGTTLVDVYVKCGSIVDARYVFDRLASRNVVSWAAMILGYAAKQMGEVALQLYVRMQQEGVAPNDRTFVGTVMACSGLASTEDGTEIDGRFVKLQSLEKGRAIHAQLVNSGIEVDVFLGTTLVDMYATCGSIEDAWHVFDKLPRHDAVSWAAMILGYAQKEESEMALKLFDQMQQEGVAPDDRAFVGALKACGNLGAAEDGKLVDGKFVKARCLHKGRAIHSQVIDCGFESNVFVGTTLVDMYAKCGSIRDARLVFDELPRHNVVSWNAMILAYAEQGENEKAFGLYEAMQEQGLSADSGTFIGILKACGNMAALESGKKIHAEIRKLGLETISVVGTTIIDMYGKCGSMVDAQLLFDTLPARGLVRWNALIAGYARQGECDLVFRLFERMKQEGIQPDGVTFLSLLTVCSHAGLVDEGQNYFEAMGEDYGIRQTLDHYTCMVDLLGRAGQVDKAVILVEKMPFEPNVVTWRTVLGACRKWNNVKVGKYAFDCAVKLQDDHPAAYVLMSNIYAHAQMWDDRDKIQAMRKDALAWKSPGQSWWTDSGGIVHTFAVGDRKHRESGDIYAKLRDMYVKLENAGYVSHLASVLKDIADDEKEDALCGHSEKLAIAYALLKAPAGATIRIVKNLRVCNDCHEFTALISKIEGRNIICRDASRFHDYKDGKCSCGDYW